MSGRGNYCLARDGSAQGPGRSGPPAAALKYRSASEPSPREMQSIGGDGRSGRAPERPPARRCGESMLHAAMGADLCRAARQSALARAARSCVFSRIRNGIVSVSARRVGARVNERCTTAAPKHVTLATKHVTTRRHKSFCNRRCFALGVATAQDFFQRSGQNQLTPGSQ